MNSYPENNNSSSSFSKTDGGETNSNALEFGGHVKGKDYQVIILVVEDLPQICIKKNGEVVLNYTVKSVDDLKIFLEERLYKFLEG